MNYLDVAYILRLYIEDAGWEKVRALAAEAPVACSLHGYAETVAALHRKYREGTFSLSEYNQVLNQFSTDCDNAAYRWLPVSNSVMERVTKTYRKLPPSVFLRASDALHLACASENGLKKIYSNDQRVISAAEYFALKGIDILKGPSVPSH
jgi:predicted nucleic acid-binding protein